MIVDLTDPKSILRWRALAPERHTHQLNYFRRYPQFSKAINEAAKLSKEQKT